jgi:hypothetical protein
MLRAAERANVEIRQCVVFSKHQPLDLARDRLYHLAHFYIYGPRGVSHLDDKTLDDRKICLMFTKNNITVSEMNSGSTSLTIYGRQKAEGGCLILDARY